MSNKLKFVGGGGLNTYGGVTKGTVDGTTGSYGGFTIPAGDLATNDAIEIAGWLRFRNESAAQIDNPDIWLELDDGSDVPPKITYTRSTNQKWMHGLGDMYAPFYLYLLRTTFDITDRGHFPVTDVLDDFNRTNGSVGGAWTTGYLGGTGLLIVSNQVKSTALYAGAGYSAGSAFTHDQECFLTFVSSSGSDGSIYLATRYVGGSDPDESGPYVEYEFGTGNLTLFDGFPDSNTLDTTPVALSPGDQLGLRVIGDTATAYVNGVLSLTGDVSGTAHPHAGNYLAIVVDGGATETTIVDNFGGGSIPTGQDTMLMLNPGGAYQSYTWPDVAADPTSVAQNNMPQDGADLEIVVADRYPDFDQDINVTLNVALEEGEDEAIECLALTARKIT